MKIHHIGIVVNNIQDSLGEISKFIKFDDVKIMLILNIVNFFPPLLALRITMKPEILVYALLPILLLHIEKFVFTIPPALINQLQGFQILHLCWMGW